MRGFCRSLIFLTALVLSTLFVDVHGGPGKKPGTGGVSKKVQNSNRAPSPISSPLASSPYNPSSRSRSPSITRNGALDVKMLGNSKSLVKAKKKGDEDQVIGLLKEAIRKNTKPNRPGASKNPLVQVKTGDAIAKNDKFRIDYQKDVTRNIGGKDRKFVNLQAQKNGHGHGRITSIAHINVEEKVLNKKPEVAIQAFKKSMASENPEGVEITKKRKVQGPSTSTSTNSKNKKMGNK